MSSAQSKRQKLAQTSSLANADPSEFKETSLHTATDEHPAGASKPSSSDTNNFGVDVDDLTDNSDSDEDEDDDDDDESEGASVNGSHRLQQNQHHGNAELQVQLAAAGPAGVAAAAAIATARKRKRAHSFETNPSVRKRQQTRLIRKLRACLDEYTMRVGQQAVVLITMPGKAVHNFKVFGAQPLESVIRSCKQEIMSELEQALLEQAPQQFKEVDSDKHELPPLVIDGIPTPVEKMTQAQLRAFIPLMLKFSTGRGKPGWGKDSTRPPWWPETLPWANVRSDARDENEKQRISWTTTLRQIVTNCYKYHGRDDLLPTFDENEESLRAQLEAEREVESSANASASGNAATGTTTAATRRRLKLESATATSAAEMTGGAIYTTAAPTYAAASNFVHTLGGDYGTVSLIQVDPANAQILTLPDGTQVRAVRLQALTGADGSLEIAPDQLQQQQHLSSQQQQQHDQQQHLTATEASLNADGQIILTGEDGIQSCYPMSSLVSIPASVYQQFAAQSGAGQQLSIVAADSINVQAMQQEQQSDQQMQQQEQQQQQADHHQVSLVEPQQTEQKLGADGENGRAKDGSKEEQQQQLCASNGI